MRFYCPVHKRSFNAAGVGLIECEKGKHLLGSPPSDASAYDIWEYCCDCQNFWLVSPDGPGSLQCPVCERAIAARYLCDQCNTVTLESVFPAKGRPVFFSLQGIPRPYCPGCKNAEHRKPARHDCEAYDDSFGTLRGECLFCHQEIAALPSFPSSVKDFLAKTNSERIEVAFDKASLRFHQSWPGTFVLLEGGSSLPGNLVLPNVSTFDSAEQFQIYEQSYSCDEVRPGEVIVVYPATVTNEGDKWSLKMAGRLRVDLVTNENSKTSATPAEIFQGKSQPAPSSPEKTRGETASNGAPVVSQEPPEFLKQAEPKKGGRLTTVVAIGVLFAASLFACFLVLAGRNSTGTKTPNQNSSTKTASSPASGRDGAVPKGMVLIPGGEFMMGSDTGDEYERPAHRVAVKPFFIDLYEVTCANYAEFVKATGHRTPRGWSTELCGPNSQQLPVTGVDWFDAIAYASWRGVRLPTEDEWEFAARGSDGRRYPWGNGWRANMANAGDSSNGSLVNVGSYSNGRSPFGVYDMVGNAWEWTSSTLQAYPGNQLATQSGGERRIMRGGSWARDDPPDWTTTFRGFAAPSGGSDYSKTGFRCAKDVSAAGRQK
jgi:formylglycine-generating enzyme required for sulfatase activity